MSRTRLAVNTTDRTVDAVVSEWRNTVEDLWLQECRSLMGLARIYIDDPADAEAAVQEAFAKLLASRSALRDISKAPKWLRSAVLNEGRQQLRRRRVARRKTPPIDAAPAEVGEDLHYVNLHRRLAHAVRALPKRQQQCVVLFYWYDMTLTQIATELGVVDGTVKKHLDRARKALAAALGCEVE